MSKSRMENEYDAIVVGSGTCGATIARELTGKGKRVLILERGKNGPLKETLLGIASIVDEVPVSDKLKDMRAITTGGSSALYFAVADPVPLDSFRPLGVDLSGEYQEVRRELPIGELPDSLLGEQSLRLRESARSLGYDWKKNMMLIDQAKCARGYAYEAKWKARSYVHDAMARGATLVNRASVSKVIVEKRRALGVEYRTPRRFAGHDVHKAYGRKIILAAGSLSTPIILRDSGIRNVASRGFFFDPNVVLFGSVPGLNGRDNFVGSMYAKLDDDVALGDANLPRIFYRMMMLAKLKPFRMATFPSSIAIGVKVKDAMGGELRENGRFYKRLTDEVLKKLKRGEEASVEILKRAGARDIISSGVNSGSVGGLLQIGEHVDSRLQTEFEGLHVCDGSVMPESARVAPTLTLLCLAKYLSKHLLSAN